MANTTSKLPALIADQLRADERVAEAKRLLREAVLEYSSRLTEVAPSNGNVADEFASLIDQLAAARGAPPYFPYIASGLGNGPWGRTC